MLVIKRLYLIYKMWNYYFLLMVFQQQHSSQVQLGHWVADLVSLHSTGRQPQSAHLIWNIVLVSHRCV